MPEKKSHLKNKKFWTYASVAIIILAALAVSLIFYRQRIEVVKEKAVLNDIRADWVSYDYSKYKIGFFHPKGYEIKEVGGMLKILDENKNESSLINLRVQGERAVLSKEPSDAIQISIPFDKKSYIVLSTSTTTNIKDIFYNIAATIEFGEKHAPVN